MTKEELKNKAQNWENFITMKVPIATLNTIEASQIYESNFHTEDNTKIIVVKDTSQAAIFKVKAEGKMAVLNFASYKTPGGGYISGMMAQEESLCHCSNLYQIISSDKFKNDFYEQNKQNLNKGLYDSRIIYSPDVVFFGNDINNTKKCDVITAAAPNKMAIEKSNAVSNYEINRAMKDRILNILHVAMKNQVEVLILGAFGCGVFHNDPNATARIFKDCLTEYHYYRNQFKLVVFAIPDDQNYNIFKNVLN